MVKHQHQKFFLYVDVLKNRILELGKQVSEKNTIIHFLTKQLLANSQDISNVVNIVNAGTILSKEIASVKIKIMTPYMKKKTLKSY